MGYAYRARRRGGHVHAESRGGIGRAGRVRGHQLRLGSGTIASRGHCGCERGDVGVDLGEVWCLLLLRATRIFAHTVHGLLLALCSVSLHSTMSRRLSPAQSSVVDRLMRGLSLGLLASGRRPVAARLILPALVVVADARRGALQVVWGGGWAPRAPLLSGPVARRRSAFFFGARPARRPLRCK